MYRSFPEEDGEARRNFGQKDGACAQAYYLILCKDAVCPGKWDKFRVSAYGIRAQGWKGWSKKIVKAFVDGAKDVGFHPSHSKI